MTYDEEIRRDAVKFSLEFYSQQSIEETVSITKRERWIVEYADGKVPS